MQTGSEGEAAVKHAFVKLGWGAAAAPEFDVGTDLFLLVRDQRLFDSGRMLGAQIKTGKAFFKEPKKDSTGQTVGWWFRDNDDEHTAYWINHVLPHILVLHDPETGTSHWVGLTADTVVSTGAGVKILVPSGNTIDEDHRDALMAFAASHHRTSPWEGSAWTGAVSISTSAMLRHALLVPRLVVPRRRAEPQSLLSRRKPPPWSSKVASTNWRPIRT
ncbi:DUF4365 domain-containing protein [Amycolatopsis tolypomycina]|uniref:DUF4365 domain-containing protein n=1 Tax=Amycolatopsis tolypomycina TaxID=208445 RepID=UPI00142D51F7|nr:DUF4365 domain-containing protein [Amycolatopsis tolypomycina]